MPRVAVVTRLAQQRAVFGEEPEVDTPRVDSDARELRFLVREPTQAVEHLAEEVQRAGVEAVRQRDRFGREAVNLLQG